jgi:hypothetical protein
MAGWGIEEYMMHRKAHAYMDGTYMAWEYMVRDDIHDKGRMHHAWRIHKQREWETYNTYIRAPKIQTQK